MVWLVLAVTLAGDPRQAPAVQPTQTPPPSGGYQLEPDREAGVYRFDGSTFKARINADGTVDFSDKHVSASFVVPFLPLPLPEGTPSLESSVRGLLGKTPRPRANATSKPAKPSPLLAEPVVPQGSPYIPDIRDVCFYGDPCFMMWNPVVIAVKGRFDLTDELMRLAGEDPYRIEKAAFLKATAAFRQAFARENRQRDEAQGIKNLYQRLAGIWQSSSMSAAGKQALYRQLRAEVDMATPGGQRAAALIDEFIASHACQAGLPPGCP